MFEHLRLRMTLGRLGRSLKSLLEAIRDLETSGFYNDELAQAKDYTIALLSSLRAPTQGTWPDVSRDLNRLGADLQVRQWAGLPSRNLELQRAVEGSLAEMEKLRDHARTLGWSTPAA